MKFFRYQLIDGKFIYVFKSKLSSINKSLTEIVIDTEKHIFYDKTVFLSVPSEGNIGQLALDIILASYSDSGSLIREGSIESHDLLPCTGVGKNIYFLYTLLHKFIIICMLQYSESFSENFINFLCAPLEG